jgi:hypothetical protein
MRQRIKDRFSTLLWDQVRPWAYLDGGPVEVKAFDGQEISILDRQQSGAREVMWDRYIEPFLEEICASEVDAIVERAKAMSLNPKVKLHELRREFVHGIIRVYWTMADVHRVSWPIPFFDRRNTSKDVGAMVAFLDNLIRQRT